MHNGAHRPATRVMADCLYQSIIHVSLDSSWSSTSQSYQREARCPAPKKQRGVGRSRCHLSPGPLDRHIYRVVYVPRSGIREFEEHGFDVRGDRCEWWGGISVDKETAWISYSAVFYLCYILANASWNGTRLYNWLCTRLGNLKCLVYLAGRVLRPVGCILRTSYC